MIMSIKEDDCVCRAYTIEEKVPTPESSEWCYAVLDNGECVYTNKCIPELENNPHLTGYYKPEWLKIAIKHYCPHQ